MYVYNRLFPFVFLGFGKAWVSDENNVFPTGKEILMIIPHLSPNEKYIYSSVLLVYFF